ncbi:MAG TPA: 1-(5-phosphoribosyl)-5-[(5-phosphoribosylamino)methylideneamino]imidazole-4-carboxamide isomerase [Cyclobacteriaceae bacterium]
MRIIPAIDIIDGKCVRLTQGDYGQMKVYRADPVDVAKEFEDADLKYLHVVDLEGAKKGQVVNWDSLQEILTETSLEIDFGGGVKTDEEVEKLLDMNVNQINIGSLAVKEPEKFAGWIKRFGASNFILSADVKDEQIQVNGWQDPTQTNIYDLVTQFEKLGLESITCTDISNDGMLQGVNLALYKKLRNRFPKLKIVASGGVGSIEDLEKLKYIGVFGTIVGKAIYEKKIQLSELTQFNS